MDFFADTLEDVLNHYSETQCTVKILKAYFHVGNLETF